MSPRKGTSRRQRGHGAAAQPPLPPPPTPRTRGKAPLTAPGIAYACLLWVLWIVSVAWPLVLMVYSFDAPRGELLVETPYDSRLIKYFAFTPMALLSLRLLVFNFEVSALLQLFVLPFAVIFTCQLHHSIESFDQMNARPLYTTQVPIVGINRWANRKGGSSAKKMLANPLDRSEIIQFWSERVLGREGDVVCVALYRGQLGGLWALPSTKCTLPLAPARPRNLPADVRAQP